MKHSLSASHALAMLLLVQLIIMWVVQPGGNFPINDDWAYAHSVEWLLSEGRIRLSDWIAPNILPQTLLGSATAAVFGFSFEALRHLTQVMALLTSFAALYWFRAGGLSVKESLVAVLVVMAMPAWPILSNSYMTDIYGLFFALLSATFFLRALSESSTKLVLFATALSCIGMLQRQVLLVIPFAFMLAWFWRHHQWNFRVLALGIMPLVLTFSAQLLYSAYLISGPGVPNAQDKTYGRLLPLFMKVVNGEDGMREFFVFNITTMAAYLGLFLVPWFAWWGIRRGHGIVRWLMPGLAAVLAVTCLALGWLPPYVDNNVIDAAGIGPYTLYDGVPRDLAGFDRSPGIIWRLAAIGAALGAVGLLAIVASGAARIARGREHIDASIVFLAAISFLYPAPFLLTGYIDRYFLFLLPFFILLWARLWPHRDRLVNSPVQRSIALGWLAVVIVLSSVGTHDYFAWNKARWKAIRHAESLGATPENLDGGFEYNGYYYFEHMRKRKKGKSWWWVKDDEYVVAFGEVPGYDLVETFEVSRLSQRTQPRIVLLRRTGE